MAPDLSRRMKLHQILLEINPNVYFQPPNGLRMKYPAIVYNRSDMVTKFANNKPYGNVDGYSVTVIDTDPDGPIRKQVSELPTCKFNRFFASDDLNHDVFTLFF